MSRSTGNMVLKLVNVGREPAAGLVTA
jgi:hypothetical protein